MENENDADYELDKMIEQYKKRGGRILGEENKVEKKTDEKPKQKRKISESDDTNSDYDIEEIMAPKKVKKIGGKDGFEIVSQEKGKKVYI